MIYCLPAMSDFARAVYVDLAASVVEYTWVARGSLGRIDPQIYTLSYINRYLVITVPGMSVEENQH